MATAAATCCNSIWGSARHSDHRTQPTTPLWSKNYYNAQAMINHDGKEWRDCNDLFRDVLLKDQAVDGTGPHQFTAHGNPHMNTCRATFMLGVFHRFLPATGAATRCPPSSGQTLGVALATRANFRNWRLDTRPVRE